MRFLVIREPTVLRRGSNYAVMPLYLAEHRERGTRSNSTVRVGLDSRTLQHVRSSNKMTPAIKHVGQSNAHGYRFPLNGSTKRVKRRLTNSRLSTLFSMPSRGAYTDNRSKGGGACRGNACSVTSMEGKHVKRSSLGSMKTFKEPKKLF